jgi:shikimate dehydrogenase
MSADVNTEQPWDRYAVIGHPVSHSRSPWLHTLFAQQTGQRLRYEALDVGVERFDAAVRDFFACGGRGLNITLPHKEAAFALAAQASERARQAGAANTLLMAGGLIHADNTDGAGLVRDLRHNLGIEVTDRRLLIAGAGGAARGVIGPLLSLAPAALWIANRTAARAADLAARFAAAGPVTAASLEQLPQKPFDLIINATAASLAGEVPALDPRLVGPRTFCYDMAYGRGDTAFMRWSRARGVYMGIGMLVEQAAESFELWRGVRPDTAPALAALTQALGG